MNPASGLCLWWHFLSESRYIATQGGAKAIKDKKCDVAFAALNSAEIGPVHLGSQCQLFLRQANALALRPDPPAQFLKDGLLVH